MVLPRVASRLRRLAWAASLGLLLPLALCPGPAQALEEVVVELESELQMLAQVLLML